MRDFLWLSCQTGHKWKTEGGRSCPFIDQSSLCPVNDVICGDKVNCSQPVFVCENCSEIDYGTDPKGPGYQHCKECIKNWAP
jgi:hypothetical protein